MKPIGSDIQGVYSAVNWTTIHPGNTIMATRKNLPCEFSSIL